MNTTYKAVILALGLVALTGCTKRSVIRFEDHATQNATYMETLRFDDYYFQKKLTHEFWLCQDQETKLVCTQTCDGKSDLLCPSGQANFAFAGSNIR
jgi:hypothetical protein